MDDASIKKQMKNVDLFNKSLFISCLLISIYCLATSSFWAAVFFFALSMAGFIGLKEDENKVKKRLTKFNAKKASKNSSIGFTVETRRKEYEHTQSDDIQELDIPSSEKIKRVIIQELPIKDDETIFADRKHKKYTIVVIPQAKDCFEFDSSKKITVYIIAGSKEEAFDALANKLSGRYSYTDENSNFAESGRWYDGNKYSLELLNFEKYKS